MSTEKGTQGSAKSSTASGKTVKGFSDRKAREKERAQELKATYSKARS